MKRYVCKSCGKVWFSTSKPENMVQPCDCEKPELKEEWEETAEALKEIMEYLDHVVHEECRSLGQKGRNDIATKIGRTLEYLWEAGLEQGEENYRIHSREW